MEKAKYIPGFDWVRIFGAILVAMSHFNVFHTFNVEHPSIYKISSVVVPLFFYMSGYLSARGMDKSRSRIWKQVIKYAAVYLAFNFALLLHDHLAAYRSNGAFDFPQFTIDFLKCFVYHYKDAAQLWFIPALLYPMMLNALLGKTSRKLVICFALLICLATESKVLDMGAYFKQLTADYPAIRKVFSPSELGQIWSRGFTGLLFTTLGFELSTRKLKPAYLLLALIPLILFELNVKIVGISRVLLSLLLFDGIMRLPGQFLRPYHPEISFFSVTLYFLHTTERKFLERSFNTSDTENLLLVLAAHVFAVAIIWYWRRESRKKKDVDVKWISVNN